MKTHRLTVVAAVLVGAVAVGAISVIHVKAQATVTSEFDTSPLSVDGFQASTSSPFVVQGTPIGNQATWQRTLGPALSNPYGMISSLSTFMGGDCRGEYTEDQIVTAQKDTLTVNVWGYRCAPFDPAMAAAGAHLTNGVYNIHSGTGKFQGVAGGAGSIQIDARPDGSTILLIRGGILSVHDSYRPF